MTAHAVIVGASLGGRRTAEQLRAQGWHGSITIVGAEAHFPYTRPPLSKAVLCDDGPPDTHAERAHAAVSLPLRDSVADVEWRLGTAAVGASLDDRVVSLADGSELRYDALVVATGLRPRRLPGHLGTESRHALRTLDDALRLRAALRPGTRVVVVGAGFVGCEVAATTRQLGCDVTVVEPAPTPLALAVPPAFGDAVRRHHESRGVVFRLGRSVERMQAEPGDSDRLRSVALDDGSVLEADVLVEAVGSLPNVEWLEGNDLDLTDGVACDNLLRAGGRPDVVAVGDIARFPNPLFDDVPRRVEHWTLVSDTARRAAATVAGGAVGDAPAFRPLPSFWSDQFDARIQAYGALGVADSWETLEGDPDAEDALSRGIALGGFADQRLTAVVMAGLPPARAMEYRKRIAETPSIPTPTKA